MNNLHKTQPFVGCAQKYAASRALLLILVCFYLALSTVGIGQLNTLWDVKYDAFQLICMLFAAVLPGAGLIYVQWSLDNKPTGLKLIIDLILATLPALLLIASIENLGAPEVISGLTAIAITGMLLWKCGSIDLSSKALSIRLILMSILIWILAYVAILASPVVLPRMTGTLFWGFLFVGLSLFWVQLIILHPRTGIISLVLITLVFFLNEQPHSLRQTDLTNWDEVEGDGTSPRAPISIQHAFPAWLASRNDIDDYLTRGEAYPVFVVTSEGGGGYAAAHSFLFLSEMQQRCPNFVQHTFAITGVSGGAVGNALFWKSVHPAPNPDSNLGCEGEVDASSQLNTLSQDNLSPIIAAMLFRDLPNKLLFGFLPGMDRSRVFIESLSDASEIGNSKNPLFKDHYWSVADDSETPTLNGGPAIIPIATNVTSGRPYIIAPFELDDLRSGYEQALGLCAGVPCELAFNNQHVWRISDIGFFDAATASASFPFVSPSLSLGGFAGSVSLVDGGYIDNSGAEALLEILRALKNPNPNGDGIGSAQIRLPEPNGEASRVRACYDRFGSNLPIHVLKRPFERISEEQLDIAEAIAKDECFVPVRFHSVTIRSRPSQERYFEEQNFFLDPINALLNGRSRRSELARLRLFDFQCAGGGICPRHVNGGIDIGYFDSVIRPQDHSLPLGWYIPRKSLEDMDVVVAPNPDANIPENYDD